MDDKLKAAIASAYRRQSELTEARTKAMNALQTLHGRLDPWLLSVLVDAIYTHYRRDLEDINTVINALEALQDAS